MHNYPKFCLIVGKWESMIFIGHATIPVFCLEWQNRVVGEIRMPYDSKAFFFQVNFVSIISDSKKIHL